MSAMPESSDPTSSTSIVVVEVTPTASPSDRGSRVERWIQIIVSAGALLANLWRLFERRD
jgi:hypothetical protein